MTGQRPDDIAKAPVRPPKLPRGWRPAFFDKLAETSCILTAARAAGISTSHIYRLRRTNAAFAQQWQAALLEGYALLELETLNRLRNGTAADGPKFDIANALRLLALHSETVGRARAALGDEPEEEAIARIHKRLAAMRAADRATRSASVAEGATDA
jgi:hypothetical protein